MPKSLKFLELEWLPSLEGIDGSLTGLQELRIEGMEGWKQVPDDLLELETMEISKCRNIHSLGRGNAPRNIDLDLTSNEVLDIEALLANLSPNTLDVRVTSAGNLRCLPNNLSPDISLQFSNCPQFRQIPIGTHCRALMVVECPAFRELPNGLKVGSLHLDHLEALESLPSDLVVTRFLGIDDVPKLRGKPIPVGADGIGVQTYLNP